MHVLSFTSSCPETLRRLVKHPSVPAASLPQILMPSLPLTQFNSSNETQTTQSTSANSPCSSLYTRHFPSILYLHTSFLLPASISPSLPLLFLSDGEEHRDGRAAASLPQFPLAPRAPTSASSLFSSFTLWHCLPCC